MSKKNNYKCLEMAHYFFNLANDCKNYRYGLFEF